MKRICLSLLLVVCLLLCGCGGRAAENKYRDFSQSLAANKNLQFTAELQAQFPEKTVEFTVDYAREDAGETVTVRKPEPIAGIRARVSEDGASLEYEGLILDLGDLDDRGFSPLSALPLLVEILSSGHLDSHWETGDLLALKLVRDDHLSADVYFEPESMTPVRAELMSDGSVLVSCRICDWR